jgi:hypothetical protein
MESNRDMSSELEDVSDFHSEVLLSYRLIFGQDRSSYSDFHSLTRVSPLPDEHHDSLLPTLCGADWKSTQARQVYEMIAADDTSTQYVPSTHFPFLGKRLLDIQTYVKGQNPSNFLSIWHDRRNLPNWWAFWVCFPQQHHTEHELSIG